MKKIVAICGSTRKELSNLQLLFHLKYMSEKLKLIFDIYNEIETIPHFNPDIEIEPESVIDFKNKLKNADGVIICSPEYAMGIPGTLKNAIDWTVQSMEFSYKNVAIITASSLGEMAHNSLINVMKILEANTDENIQLLISSVKTKVSKEKILDLDTEKALQKILENLTNRIAAQP